MIFLQTIKTDFAFCRLQRLLQAGVKCQSLALPKTKKKTTFSYFFSLKDVFFSLFPHLAVTRWHPTHVGVKISPVKINRQTALSGT